MHSRGRADERLVYVLNWGHETSNVTAEMPWQGQTELQGKDIVSGSAVAVEHKDNRVVFHLTLPPTMPQPCIFNPDNFLLGLLKLQMPRGFFLKKKPRSV